MSAPPFPATGRLLGVDFGTVRVGLAVSDPDRVIASPLDTLTRTSEAADAASLMRVVAAERIVGIVVGLPLHTGGEEGKKAAQARAYGTWLATVTNLPVAFSDERFTTAMADDSLREARVPHHKRRERRDRIAAQLILRAFLDAGCPTDAPAADPSENVN